MRGHSDICVALIYLWGNSDICGTLRYLWGTQIFVGHSDICEALRYLLGTQIFMRHSDICGVLLSVMGQLNHKFKCLGIYSFTKVQIYGIFEWTNSNVLRNIFLKKTSKMNFGNFIIKYEQNNVFSPVKVFCLFGSLYLHIGFTLEKNH